jgi:D-alanine transaminase
MADVAFLNGRFLPLAEAMVSVEDRGFLFGDGVYEVIRTYGGALFQLDAHLARLDRSAAAIGLAMPHAPGEWPELIREAIRRGGHAESKVYLQVTRGVAPRDHAFPQGVQPTVLLTVRAMWPLTLEVRSQGVRAVTMEDVRWGRCDIKSLNLLPNVLARQRAKEADTFEAIFVKDGLITEGSVSNVMLARNGALMTPPEGPGILSGVTRQVVLDLARKDGLFVRECAVSLDDLRTADEVFLTGTTVEVLSVTSVDGREVGSGRPGPVARRLQERFDALVGGVRG